MIVSAWNPPTEELEKSYLSAVSQAGSGFITVKNTNKFPQNKAVMIGEMGMEQSELLVTAAPTTTPESRINLTTNTVFSHASDEPVYLMRYDQVLFYRATAADGVYTLISTQAVDVDNRDGKTYYEDTTGTPNSFYKTKYRNSISLEETEFSDYISAEGYARKTIGSVMDGVVRRVKDIGYSLLSAEDYLDIANEVNDDILSQAARPYNFMRKSVPLDRVANQNYLALPADYMKFESLEYTNTVGTMPRTKGLFPVTRRQFDSAYGLLTNSDIVRSITLDDENKKILVKPTARTNATGAYQLWYFAELAEFEDLSQAIQTPSPLIYRYKFLAEAYSVKAEVDPSFGALATKYEQKYGNELMKMQRMNRKDVGTPRSFMGADEISSIPRPYIKRYTL